MKVDGFGDAVGFEEGTGVRERASQVFIIFDSSIRNTAETCINVRIVRLEPVPERAPEQRRRGQRRAAFHDVMLAVEEISRVAAIERLRLEAFERCERRPRPLPAIAEEPANAEGTVAVAMRIDAARLPRTEIEIASSRFG